MSKCSTVSNLGRKSERVQQTPRSLPEEYGISRAIYGNQAQEDDRTDEPKGPALLLRSTGQSDGHGARSIARRPRNGRQLNGARTGLTGPESRDQVGQKCRAGRQVQGRGPASYVSCFLSCISWFYRSVEPGDVYPMSPSRNDLYGWSMARKTIARVGGALCVFVARQPLRHDALAAAAAFHPHRPCERRPDKRWLH